MSVQFLYFETASSVILLQLRYIHATEFPYDLWSCKRRHQKNVFTVERFIMLFFLFFYCFTREGNH